MEKDINWECPKCKQLFYDTNQKHHCIPTTINVHLDKCTPSVRSLFFSLDKKMQTFGDYEIIAANSSIQFKSESVFLTARFKSNNVELEFQSNSPKTNIKTSHNVKISNKRFLHKTSLNNESELTPELLNLLYDSYKINDKQENL
jgi:hypothetical protein